MAPCANACGREAFQGYPTCCKKCSGPNGKHAKDCAKKASATECANGCGRACYKDHPTCCTKCTGPDGPHAKDCAKKDAWASKLAQRGNSKKKKHSAKPAKQKTDKGAECEAILDDMDAFSLEQQMAAVHYQRQSRGLLSLLNKCQCRQTDAEEQLCENLMTAIDAATAGLDPKDLWASWMKLFKLMYFAQQMGWDGEDSYEAAYEQAQALGLSMDDSMDLEKVEVTDAKALQTMQSLFDTCSVDCIDGAHPLNRIKVNRVEQIFHEQTRAEYLLKRQQLIEELNDDPNYPRISVPSQQVNMAVFNGGVQPVEANYNEFYLFHGTSDTVAELIANSDFLIKSSADNGWTFGKGVYAAEWVSHAQMFAMMENEKSSGVASNNGELCILVCRAFAGRCQNAGNWPITATPCPQVAELEANIESGAAHATTGSEWPQSNFRVHDFILPDDDQILPEFICHCSF